MRCIEASYRIVTPMFIGDAQQKATDVRPPSVKGALRFWWRALNWGRCLSAAGDDEAAALVLLHQQESRLFGQAAVETNGERAGGQGCFLLRVKQPGFSRTVTDWPVNNTGSGYLGFGLLETNQQGHREGIPEGLEFGLELRFRPQTPEGDVASVREALETWGLLGGLGSRSRRSFGSVSLLKLDGEDQRLTRAVYESKVAALLEEAETVRAWPPYTAFSAHAGFSVLASSCDPRAVHNAAGQSYREHRGQQSNLRGAAKVPFGLPLQKVDEKYRRASPLLFHVHALAEGEYLAAVLYLPAVFHPEQRYKERSAELEHFYQDVAHFMETEEKRV